LEKRLIVDEIGTECWMARNDNTYHLQQMVVEKEPIKYLEKYL